MGQTDNNRKILLNISNGGSGHFGQWVEHVIFDATDDAQAADGYIVHTEQFVNGKELQISGGKHIAQLLTLITNETTPTDAEIDAVPIEDYGRHVTAAERKHYNI